jgi:branched-chain amino acid transport system substrate-binding protein
VFVGGYFGDAAVIARDMEARGMDIPLIGGEALETPEFWAIAGPAGEATLFTAPADPREAPAARDLVAGLKAGGAPAQPYTVYAYAAVEVLAQALAAAPEDDYAGLSRALNEGQFDTVLGTVRFDDKGDANVPAYDVFEWSQGRIEPVAP